MYPQLVIFGIAAWKKDKLAVWYGTVLSVIGAFIAGSQYYLQMSGHSLIPCSAEPETAICAQRLVFEFGYITLPLMSLTAFVMIILLLITRAKVDKTS